MTVLYRSGLMLTPPVALAGHAFTRTNHPGQWRCLRCHTLTHDIHHTTITGTCTGLAAAITTGAPMTTSEPLPIAATMTAPSARLTINFTIDISGTLRYSLDLTFDQLRTAWAHQLQQDPEWADGQDLRRTLELWLEEQLGGEAMAGDLDTAIERGLADIMLEAVDIHISAEEYLRAGYEALTVRQPPPQCSGQLDIFGNEVTP